jgi:hypothetical protein
VTAESSIQIFFLSGWTLLKKIVLVFFAALRDNLPFYNAARISKSAK